MKDLIILMENSKRLYVVYNLLTNKNICDKIFM